MNSKEYLTNRAFCPVPWTGLMYSFNGNIKNCIRSADTIGNIRKTSIQDIVNGDQNIQTRTEMLLGVPATNCYPCYSLEQEKNNFNVISDRVFYLKELKSVPLDTYTQPNTFNLHTVDVRWSNLCNFTCVYCSPEFSSRWASELNIDIVTPIKQKQQEFKNYIFKHAEQLKHVYLAGGEPLLMKENLEFLQLLKECNPNVNLRINTNLSKVDTNIFDLICEFKNVHWTVSVETIEQEYEYIRYGGRWGDFLNNLNVINNLDHKISFNMLYFLLNYNSLFDCIDFFKGMGFHNNSFIVGALTGPDHLDVRHLPDSVLKLAADELQKRIDEAPGFLLENGYRNLLLYINKPMIKKLSESFALIKQMDQRRNIDSKTVFKRLYQHE